MSIAAFRAELGDIPQEDNARIVQQRSRDHYFYSPVLKAKLDHVTAEVVVSPRSTEEVKTVLRAAFKHDVPITPRGAGTGNYGQAMPLAGGAMLNLMNMDKVLDIQPDRVRAQAGAVLEKLDHETKAAVNGELRFHPSTHRMASLGGFIAGGSGGVGSVRWGGLRNLGSILGLKIVTCEAEPREIDLSGEDILKVAHAYGTNGIIVEAEMPLAQAYDWVDMIVGFDDFMDACRFAEAVALQDGLLVKEVAPCAAPIPEAYFNRHKPYLKDGQSVVLLMVAPVAVAAMELFIRHRQGELRYRSDTATPEEIKRLPPVYELAWNHTTLRALKVDPAITYLQTRYPTSEHVEKICSILGDELLMHIEITRQDGKVTYSGLPLVRYTTEARLEEIIRIHEDNGCDVFNPHRFTLEEGGMKRTDQRQLDFKREADPKGMLNPGKMVAWENPDFDFSAGKAWLFDGLNPVHAA
ncbi:MAG: FAD-binding oxidoreductase [Candidatus Devosia phytovorans]|uniref:FAD-binding oxidoreductase n=1 Tax=Candidatus Devosia phytovorans TaxID=3121372 RepID=A0AAJ5VYY6_9HYPH|nr:FAD-binding oxidoreductase [Devosia sp.]WEK06450.1 MAG: FAD-binding oxidoreductase [Devosia sp.]